MYLNTSVAFTQTQLLCKKFCKFYKKTLAAESLFDKVTGLHLESLLKKTLRHRCFPVNFARFFITAFLQHNFRKTAPHICFNSK